MILCKSDFAFVLAVCCGLAVATRDRLVGAQTAAERSAFERGQALAREGKDREAFLKYLAEPGGEHAAAALARPKAREFLAILREQAHLPAARLKLIEGDLLLALGSRPEALVCYREVARRIATKDQEGFEQGLLPRGNYWVEPPQSDDFGHGAWPGPAAPLSSGPGSHRDNWLIRRFIPLEAWSDARAEFERVWQLHREGAGPTGFHGLALQFALDYAFFLNRRDDPDAAQRVLLQALVAIDMDRDPNNRQPLDAAAAGGRLRRPFNPWGTSGVSRKEFIRLAFGEFKTAGREQQLVAALQKQIDGGQNRLRRVLARVRLHQGQTPEALALELAYIAAGELNPLSTQYRRGLAFEEVQKLPEAAAAFEQVFALRFEPLSLPDADEEIGDAYRMSAVAQVMGSGSPPDQAALHAEVIARLERLYSALGETQKLLQMTLRQFEATPASLRSFEALESAAQRFKAAGQEARFAQWAGQRLAESKDPLVRANLQWLLGDKAAALESISATADRSVIEAWRPRLGAAGDALFRQLIERLVAANPHDARLRLELLELEGAQGAGAIASLELVLAADAEPLNPRGRGGARSQFTSYFDLAYRLLRLYERQDQLDKVQALGLRIARRQKPFDQAEPWIYGVDLSVQANACLALAIQHAQTKQQQTALAEALQESPWSGARSQIARRLAGGGLSPMPAQPAFGWTNAPEGVRLLASNENVLALARDDKFVYAGQPWGVAVYDLRGNPVTRVALAEAARALAVIGENVWAGTPKGLFRITRDTWGVAHQWLHDDVSLGDRHSRSFPGVADYWFDNGVYKLAANGEMLWIGLHRNVQALNTRTLELRPFSFEELKIESWAGFDEIVPDGPYVWADSPHAGLRRYDRAADQWSTPEKMGPRVPVRFLGIIDGQVYGNVYLNDTLRHRPCRIDRQTLAVTPLLLEAASDQQLINSPLAYFGKLNGRLVFGPGHPAYVLDVETGKLRPIEGIVEKLAETLRDLKDNRTGDERLSGARETLDRLTEHERLFGQPHSGEWLHLLLPDGTRVLGARADRTRYEYPHEDRPDELHDQYDRDGGLFFVPPDGTPRRVSSSPRVDSLWGDHVLSLLPAKEQDWLCTSLGLAALDGGGRVAGRFTRNDGLCANRVPNGVNLAGKLYFATGWDDSSGGLAVFDPRTSVFTSLHRSDGMDTDKLASISAEGASLRLTYAMEYLRYNSVGDRHYRRFPPGTFDPQAGTFTSGGEPRLMTQTEAGIFAPAAPREPLPYLGGFVHQRLAKDGKTYFCGTRGLVIVAGDTAPEMKFAALGATLIEGPSAKLLADAERRPVKISSPADLAAALKDANPYYRANALADAFPKVADDKYLPLVAGQLDDVNLRVRSTALLRLTQFKDNDRVIPLLRARLDDADPYCRAVATLALARRGVLLPVARIRDSLATEHFGNFPFGAKSTVGVQVTRFWLHEALAPLATPEIFALLLADPPSLQNHDNEVQVFPQLGQSLRRHPSAVPLLLKAHDDPGSGHERRDFARDVFRFAGAELLPALHAALASDDRVVRSNAARACGALGDRSSIEPLLQSLDLESGLARASIVWALGELKAEAALPALAKLFVDATNDERRRGGSGFRAGQVTAALSAQYDGLRSLEAIGGEWDELKASTLAPPRDPRYQEDLLQSQHILEAVGKIGAAAAGGFYRLLAADRDSRARQEAAVHLAAGSAEDRQQNQVILRNLLSDRDNSVRIRAAVSLVMLGDREGERVVLENLQANPSWQPLEAIRQLERIQDGKQLRFARAQLTVLASNPMLHKETRDLVKRLLQAAGR